MTAAHSLTLTRVLWGRMQWQSDRGETLAGIEVQFVHVINTADCHPETCRLTQLDCSRWVVHVHTALLKRA